MEVALWDEFAVDEFAVELFHYCISDEIRRVTKGLREHARGRDCVPDECSPTLCLIRSMQIEVSYAATAPRLSSGCYRVAAP